MAKAVEYRKECDPSWQEMAGRVERGGVRALVEEYLDLRKEKPPDHLTTKASEENIVRNRYKDVPCWDQSRVKLTGGPVDYIHGNWVDGLGKQRQFIATQGPLNSSVPGKMEPTTSEFWRMVWEHKVTVIVMLCQTVETNKPKCAQYWPERPGQKAVHGPITVETIDVQSRAIQDHQFSISILKVSDNRGGVRALVHCLHKSWPDRNVPPSAYPLVDFQAIVGGFHSRMAARLGLTKEQSPLVVHCSAGIGRTGTFLVIDICVALLGRYGAVNVREVVRLVRTQRLFAVQTSSQYVCVYQTLLEWLVRQKGLKFDMAKFNREAEAHLKAAELEPPIPLKPPTKPAPQPTPVAVATPAASPVASPPAQTPSPAAPPVPAAASPAPAPVPAPVQASAPAPAPVAPVAPTVAKPQPVAAAAIRRPEPKKEAPPEPPKKDVTPEPPKKEAPPEPKKEMGPAPEPKKEMGPAPEPKKEMGPAQEPKKEMGPAPEPKKEMGPAPEPKKEMGPAPEPKKEIGPQPEAKKDSAAEQRKEMGPQPEPKKEMGPQPEPKKEMGPAPEPRKESSAEPKKEMGPLPEPKKEMGPLPEPKKETKNPPPVVDPPKKKSKPATSKERRLASASQHEKQRGGGGVEWMRDVEDWGLRAGAAETVAELLGMLRKRELERARRRALTALLAGDEAALRSEDFLRVLGHLGTAKRRSLKGHLRQAIRFHSGSWLHEDGIQASEWTAALGQVQKGMMLVRCRYLMETAGEATGRALHPLPDEEPAEPEPDYEADPFADPFWTFSDQEQQGRAALDQLSSPAAGPALRRPSVSPSVSPLPSLSPNPDDDEEED